MVTVAQARAAADKKLRNNLGKWAAATPEAPALLVTLHPPTEQQARTDLAATLKWVNQWREATSNTVEVEWTVRSWPSLGTQALPTRLRIQSADAVATFASAPIRRQWQTLSERADLLRARFGDTTETGAMVKRHSSKLLALSDHDFDTLVAVVSWLANNSVTGLRPRQLPIRGIDSKWFGKHRSLVEAWHNVTAPSRPLGIVDSYPLVHMRILDPRLMIEHLHDFAAPVSELTDFAISPRLVFVMENKETMLAMPPWPGAVVIFGSGYAAGILGQLRWLATTPIIYWGDLDSDGFAILNQVRSHLPQTVSALMDQETLLRYRDLWVTDPSPNSGVFPQLTTEEHQTLQHVRKEGNVRLEQERIPWNEALAALHHAENGL